MTKYDQFKKYLKSGRWITPLMAWNVWHIWGNTFNVYIKRVKDSGWEIESERVEGKDHKKHRLVKKP